MVLGVDDLLAVAMAASTSFVAWSRIDSLMEKVCQHSNPRILQDASESPSLLMSGFDLAASSGVGAPQVPHRNKYNVKRSILNLVCAEESEFLRLLPLYDRSERNYLASVIEQHSLWAAALRYISACKVHKLECTPHDVQSSLHALLRSSCFSEAIALYCATGAGMPISQEIIATLVASSSDPLEVKRVLQICDQSYARFEPPLVAASIASLSSVDWARTLHLYSQYCRDWCVDGCPSLLRAAVPACVASHGRAEELLRYTRRCHPTAEADILLKMLESQQGRQQFERLVGKSTWRTAVDLLATSPTTPNTITTVGVLLHSPLRNADVVPSLLRATVFSESQWSAIAAVVSASPNWRTAARVADIMIGRSTVDPSPLVLRIARSGQWDLALRALTTSLARRRAAVSSHDASFAVFASLRRGRWMSSLFWLERAQRAGALLPPTVYDQAFQAAKYTPWSMSLQLLRNLRGTGASCTPESVRAIIDANAAQGHTEDALRILSASNSVSWVQ